MANNRLAYAIAESHGIDTSGMSPKEVWQMLAERGISVAYPQDTKYSDMINAEKGEEREEYKEETKGSGKNSKAITLPKQEFAELCSAIRTKYGNKIPKKGRMLYKDSYYWYNYDDRSCRITCSKKVSIEGNEVTIAILEGKNE